MTDEDDDKPDPVAVPLGQAIDKYLDWAIVHAFKPGSGTPRTYGIKLGMYARHFGYRRAVCEITGREWQAACGKFWNKYSPETYNSGRRAALSFLAFCRDSEPPLTIAAPPKLWKPRPVPKKRDQAFGKQTIAGFLDVRQYALREVSLWSTLYDSSERLSSVLTLDIPQVDLTNRMADVRIKGGDTRTIAWGPVTNEFLRLQIGERTWGPVWLGLLQPWNHGDREECDKGPPAHDPTAGPKGSYAYRYRLSAHRARIIFREQTGYEKPHRFRHSRLTHLGSTGQVGTPMLKAISGHESEKSLARYSRPSPEDVAAFMAQLAPLIEG